MLRVSVQLADRTAIVTGSASGIGRAIAISLADAGAEVVAADVHETPALDDRDESTVEAIRERGGTAIYHETDVASEDDVEDLVDATVAAFGGIDVLVNNAGITATNGVDTSPTEEWENVVDVNLNGVFHCAKHAVPYLKESPSGRIINISSARAFVGAPEKAAYCASKGGVSNLTRQLAVDYGDDGVTVNAVCPGPVKTDMIGEDESEWEAYREHVLTPFIGDPDDVANVVTFLASDEARYVTGHNLLVDGGANAH